ncbi:MAG: hypothetical protein ACFCU1_03540 [Sumerlaeia bacterium]
MTIRMFEKFTLAFLLLATPLIAGTTLPGTYFMQEGAGLSRSNGDFVSNSATGLNAPYRYYIEVPPLLPNLTVELFDSDIGLGADEAANTGAPGNRDRSFGGAAAYNTQVTYRLIDPLGVTVQSLTRDNTNGVDNGWELLASIPTPLNGHWLLEVDMSTAVTTGDDINGFGIRAHDGDSGSGGVELNIYAESFIILGTHALPNNIAITYYKYPYITSGCECYYRDFDADDQATFTDSWIDLESRNGAFNPPATNFLSADNVWNTKQFVGFADDGAPAAGILSDGYGIWPSEFRVDGVTRNGSNYIGYYVAAFNAPGAPFQAGDVDYEPTNQPEENSFRIYLPRDGSTVANPVAPVQPYVRQFVYDVVSGPNPPVLLQNTFLRMNVEVVNPTPFPITFSPTNVVTVNVPSPRVEYQDNGTHPAAFATQGTVLTDPADGGNGNITWNPGIVAPGATARLEYRIRVRPTADNQTTMITGTPALDGTTARFVDGTGNFVQSRATYTFGPICQLSLVSGLSGTTLSVDLLEVQTEALENGSIRLVWETIDEVENAGFEVLSATRSGDVFVEGDLLTLSPIPSIGSSGGTYEWIDDRVFPLSGNQERGYYLVDIDFSGLRTYHGPYLVTGTKAVLSGMNDWTMFN